MKAKRRYVVGLEKLAFAASQVGRGHRVQSVRLRVNGLQHSTTKQNKTFIAKQTNQMKLVSLTVKITNHYHGVTWVFGKVPFLWYVLYPWLSLPILP